MGCVLKRENQEQRRREIEAAAYAVLQEKGYKATSMLMVAKRASASNETLYRWYGNKQTLFAALVASNLEDVRAYLSESIRRAGDLETTLFELGVLLLELVTGEKAIALNRAAATDVYESNSLGATIAEGGRKTIKPMVADVLKGGMEAGELQSTDPEMVAEVYLNLVIGDLQIQRVIGVLPLLEKKAVEARVRRACEHFFYLFQVR